MRAIANNARDDGGAASRPLTELGVCDTCKCTHRENAYREWWLSRGGGAGARGLEGGGVHVLGQTLEPFVLVAFRRRLDLGDRWTELLGQRCERVEIEPV